MSSLDPCVSHDLAKYSLKAPPSPGRVQARRKRFRMQTYALVPHDNVHDLAFESYSTVTWTSLPTAPVLWCFLSSRVTTLTAASQPAPFGPPYEHATKTTLDESLDTAWEVLYNLLIVTCHLALWLNSFYSEESIQCRHRSCWSHRYDLIEMVLTLFFKERE